MDDSGDQRKKRKFEVEEEEEEESDEAKMEKFYELIRISKDIIRARMIKIHGERLKMMKEQKGFIHIGSNRISSSSVNNGGSWNPTFQLEDFMEDHGQKKKKLQVINSHPILNSSSRINNMSTTATAAGPSNSKKDNTDDDEKGGDDHTGLNLNLSL